MRLKRLLDCAPTVVRGSLVERTLFRNRAAAAGDGASPVLRHADRFAHGELAAGAGTATSVDHAAQTVFFVADGSGALIADGREHRLREGDGVFVPAGVEHALRCDGDRPLEILLVEESLPSGARPARASVLIRNYRDSEVGIAHWSYRVQRIFGPEDGMACLRTVLVVSMDPMTTGDVHGHGFELDEVWYMWRGLGIHRVDREICVQTPGTAIQVAPSEPGHTLMNHTDEPLCAFYFHAT